MKTSKGLAQLRQQLGMIPRERIVLDPVPGTATEEDLLARDIHTGRLCELVDGCLVEKAMGYRESLVATYLVQQIGNFLDLTGLGIVLGADAFLRLVPGLIRAPDVSYISWDQFPGGILPDVAIPSLAPDLAVEVISAGNTKKEMDRKLREYFVSGTRLVWYIYPKTRSAAVYTSPDQVRRLRPTQTLEGGEVLPNFALPLSQLFNARRRPSKQAE